MRWQALPEQPLPPERPRLASGGKQTRPGTELLTGVKVPVKVLVQLPVQGQELTHHQRECHPRERKDQPRVRQVLLRLPRLQELPLLGCRLPQFLRRQPRGPPLRSVLLLFRRISDCLSPLKVFRLEGNTHVLHRNRTGRASYFRENESIVTGSTGAPSVSLLPGVMPAAARLDTTSSPEVTFPTTV